MPLYEYQCQDCGAVMERLRSLHDPGDDPPQCDCGSRQTVRIEFSRVAVGHGSAGAAGGACCNPGGT